MLEIINYIRSWFYTPPVVIQNKRRSQFDDEYDNSIRNKIRRMADDRDDWLATSLARLEKNNSRKSLHKNDTTPNVTIDLDASDDDIIEVKPKKLVSPIFPRRINKPMIPDRKSNMFVGNGDFFSMHKDSPFGKIGIRSPINNVQRSSTSSRTPSSPPDSRPSSTKSPNTVHNSTALDETFRLDEKLKYKQMLEQAAPNLTFRRHLNEGYLSPTGRVLTGLTRCRKMVESARNGVADGRKCTAKDTIMKVLDETIVIKDDDSDVEVLPTPPSPKPDIKTERVNSLKRVINTEVSDRKWLEDINRKHREKIRSKEETIKQLNEHRRKLSEVNSEIRIKTLEESYRKCLSLKEIIVPVLEQPTFPALSNEQQQLVERAFSKSGSSSEVLVRKFNLSITRNDIMTLAGLNWLNDEVINFYMNLIMERGKRGKWPKTYAMNTFFYPKLLRDGPQSLRRWTKKVDIFSYDLIAVPIHLDVHWCMSMIDFRQKTIKYYDSMGGTNRKVLPALMDYLEKEHMDKKGREFDSDGWKTEIVRDIPQQMNGSDCGMFSCTFAEFLSRDARFSFSQEDMPYLRKKMVVEILTGELLVT